MVSRSAKQSVDQHEFIAVQLIYLGCQGNSFPSWRVPDVAFALVSSSDRVVFGTFQQLNLPDRPSAFSSHRVLKARGCQTGVNFTPIAVHFLRLSRSHLRK